MSKGGFKQSWRTMIKFFKDKEWRNQAWDEAVSNYRSSNTGIAINSLVNKVTGTDITAADRAQNEFNAAEAEKQRDWSSVESAAQRDWSSQEAEIARDWQEEMYYKYNSLSGKIAQAEEAGVNPMFAVTGNSVSPMTTSSPMPSSGIPSGASAHGGNPTTESFVNLIGQIAGLVKLKSEVNLLDSEANKNNAEAEGQSITNSTLREWNVTQILESRSRIDYNNENTALVTSKILNTDADTEKKSAELGQIASSIANMNADTNVKVQQLGVMASEIIKNTKSLDVMSAQIAEMASNVSLNKEKGKEIAQNVRNLVQQYGHDSVMNEINEIVGFSSASMASRLNPDNYDKPFAKAVRQFLNEFKDLFNFSGSSVYSSK